MKLPRLSTGRWIQVAVALELVAVGVITLVFLHFTPSTFFAFALVGAPLMILGVLIYIWRVVASLLEKGAL